MMTEMREAELLRAERTLQALEAGGVDNWGGYDESMREIWLEDNRDEIIAGAAGEIMELLSMYAYEPSERGAGIAFEDDAEGIVITELKCMINQYINEAN